ncbi:MAG: hypothetical protein GWO24_23460, partial [Akkermansiaceae bacterium]|nr:hypothetical protein [Akkermansiaceae bacterium]
AIPIDSEFQKEAIQVEVRPSTADPAELHESKPAEQSALLSELSETSLPEPEPPVLEERTLAEAPEPAQPADDQFRPTRSMPAAIQPAEPNELAEPATRIPTDPSRIEPAEP